MNWQTDEENRWLHILKEGSWKFDFHEDEIPLQSKAESYDTVFNRAVQMTVGGVVGRYRQILDGSISAVSKPIFARKYSFCRVFRDLQDLHTFAPLQSKKSAKFGGLLFFWFFCEKVANFFVLELKFVIFRTKLDGFFWEFCQISQNLKRYLQFCGNLWKILKFDRKR